MLLDSGGAAETLTFLLPWQLSQIPESSVLPSSCKLIYYLLVSYYSIKLDIVLQHILLLKITDTIFNDAEKKD